MSITIMSAWLLLLSGHGVVPSNDDCANAEAIFFGSTVFSTTDATDSGAPIDNSQCPDTYLGTVSQDVWFRLTAIDSGTAIVSTCSSVDFDTEASEDVLEAAVYIVCWNLGIRAGADLIEEIRSHPRLEGKCVLVAVKEPTKTVVTWAMSLGAEAVCSLPYDPGEVGERLEEIENAA